MEEDEGAPIAETNGEAEAPVADGALVGSRTDAPKGDDTPDSSMVLQFESSPSTKRDSAASSDGEGAVPIKRRSENGNDSNERPIQKDAHLRDDEDLLGYETTGDESALDNLCSAIERLKKEINSIENSNERLQDSSPPPNIATGNAMDDTVSSRPSSGMSMRSENELGNLNIDMNSASGNRPSFNRKSGVELTNQIYRIPLELGWRRELVYRANFDQNARRQADIYYYSPGGKKLRSTREVSEHLIGTNLTVENFTFFKEALGVDDPEKEIIREAKVLKSKNDSPQPSDGEGQGNTLEGKRTPKPKAPKGSSPERLINAGKSKPLKVKSVGSRLSTGSSPSPTGFNPAKMSPGKDSGASSPKPALRKSADSPQWKKPMHETEEAMEAASSPFSFSPEKLGPVPPAEKLYFGHNPSQQLHHSTVPPRIFPSVVSDMGRYPASQTKKYSPSASNQMGRDMCPMRCPLANTETPTLQCSLCLCLYHSQCTGFLPNNNTSYVCKNCHMSNSTMSTSPPSLTHVSSMRTSPKGLSTISGPPTLQRFPKPSPTSNKVPQPRLVPVVTQVPVRQKSLFNHPMRFPKSDYLASKTAHKYPKPLAYSDKMNKNYHSFLNSWPSQTTDNRQDNVGSSNKYNDVDASIFPQSIATLNGHKFIVVPKPNPMTTLSALSGQGTNPRHADNAPKMMDAGNSITTGAATTSVKPLKLTDDLKDEPKLQFKTLPKSDTFGNTNVISFDNLSTEYGKFIFKGENVGYGHDAKGTKRSLSSDIEESPGAKRKARGPPTPKMVPKIAKKAENGTAGQKVGPRGGKVVEAKNKNYFAEFYRTNKEKGYNSLVQIFQYLKMRELAAAARVCRMWRDIAYTPALWKSVRMKNSQVNDWEGLAAALKRHGTRHLDLRKMLHHHPPEVPDKAWDQFIEHISTVDTLIRLDLCRCPASVVERVCERMPQLQALTATSVRCTSLNPAPLTTLTNLQELRIKGMTGLTLTSDLKCLENLTKLKHLCITSVKELGKYGCIAVGGLTMLESLELGECTGEVGGSVLLRRLTNLTRLRLERCPGNTNGGGAPLLKAAAALPLLRQLELINFDIKPGFEDALGLCTNVKRLLIIPTYVSQSATTNRCVLAGVLRLRSTLTHLVWGVTMELLRVTELFIDQCDRTQSQSASGGTTGNSLGDAKQTQHNAQATTPKVRKQGVGDCIPVLKPVPGLPAEEVRMADMAGRPQVEILPLPALQHLLAAELPETRLKLLRIPYHHTWRQTFNDFD